MLRRTLQISGPIRTLLSSNRLAEIRYTKDHYWVERIKTTDEYKVGLSDYAQDSYGDFVVVEIERMNEIVDKDEEIGNVESVKSIASIYAPMTGEVLEMNKAIDTDKGRPQLINRDPLGKGWILKMKATVPEELDELFTEEEYNNYLIENELINDKGDPIKG